MARDCRAGAMAISIEIGAPPMGMGFHGGLRGWERGSIQEELTARRGSVTPPPSLAGAGRGDTVVVPSRLGCAAWEELLAVGIQ